MTDSIVCRRLVGRTAVITGAGSGIGLATARRLASEGAHVVCGDIDETAGKAAAEEVGGTFVRVDVTDPEQVEALFKTAFDTYGSVDIAFNNAGISPPTTTPSSPPAWRRGSASRTSTSPPSTSAARPPCPTCGARAAVPSSTRPPSSPSWAPPRARSPTPPPRAACSPCPVNWGSSSPATVSASTRSARGPSTPPPPGAVRQGPGARRPPSGAHPRRPVRRGRGDRRGRGLPGQRRLLLRQRHRLPRRRRDLRRLRDPPVGPRGRDTPARRPAGGESVYGSPTRAPGCADGHDDSARLVPGPGSAHRRTLVGRHVLDRAHPRGGADGGGARGRLAAARRASPGPPVERGGDADGAPGSEGSPAPVPFLPLPVLPPRRRTAAPPDGQRKVRPSPR